MATGPSATAARLLAALTQIHVSTPRLLASAPSTSGNVSRQASVAIIIRMRPSTPITAPTTPPTLSSTSPSQPSTSQNSSPPASPPPPTPSSIPPTPRSVVVQLQEFFDEPWVKKATPEILFIKRASRLTDKWSGHIAFPGGRQEPEDENAHYAAMRETWEEVGLDLAEKEWLSIGQLDDREITTSLGKRLLMILSPFVFLHTSPATPIPELQETEVASAHWIPLELLHAPLAKYGSVGIDISSRLAPRNAVARVVLRMLVGTMKFRCVLLPNDPVAIGQISTEPEQPDGKAPDLRLWGLTLGMTLDLLSIMANASISPLSSGTTTPPADLSTYPHAVMSLDVPLPSLAAPKGSKVSPLAPSTASIFPTFSYPDINALIWVFGWRYRRLLSQSQNRPRAVHDARVNWAGMSLGMYYAAVRRALLVACVLRAIAAISAASWLGLWIARRRRRRSLL